MCGHTLPAGNAVALYSCVNELLSAVTAPQHKSGGGGGGAGLSAQSMKRVGALECLAHLARSGHGGAMSGSAGGFVAAVTKLMKAAGEDGSHVLRRAAMHALAAVVAGSTPDRPLRAETRAEAAKVIIRAMTPDKSSSSSAPSSSSAVASAAASYAGMGGGVRAAAAGAMGALASSPGGGGLWAGSASGKSGGASAGEEAAAALSRLLEDADDVTHAAAAGALVGGLCTRRRLK